LAIQKIGELMQRHPVPLKGLIASDPDVMPKTLKCLSHTVQIGFENLLNIGPETCRQQFCQVYGDELLGQRKEKYLHGLRNATGRHAFRNQMRSFPFAVVGLARLALESHQADSSRHYGLIIALFWAMPCQQCDTLSRELKARERDRVMAVQCMDAVNETIDAVVFQRFRSKLSDARMEHELARLTLEKHQQDGHATQQ
jgi:hypothetical protein